MNLEERLQSAEAKGYISVKVEAEGYFFFVESDTTLRVGDSIKNARGVEFKVTKIESKSRIVAEEIQ